MPCTPRTPTSNISLENWSPCPNHNRFIQIALTDAQLGCWYFRTLFTRSVAALVYYIYINGYWSTTWGALEIALWNPRWQICKLSLCIINHECWNVVAITLAERMTSIWFQPHHVEHAATVAGTWVMAAFSNVVRSYRMRIACTGDRTAHMRLNSSAQPRKRALTAGLPLCSEAKMRADLHIWADPLRPDCSLCSPQHIDLQHYMPPARCEAVFDPQIPL